MSGASLSPAPLSPGELEALRGLQLHSGRDDVSGDAKAQLRDAITEFDLLIAGDAKDAG